MSEDCPHCEADVGTRKIGVEVQGVYDGVLFWRCADCNKAFHRFPEGHALRALAAPYVEKP